MRNSDKAAMPSTVWDHDNDGNTVQTLGGGLTKREHFAAMAMQGIIASLDKAVPEDELAREAVTAADALLKALEES